jgi:hypothetical protein
MERRKEQPVPLSGVAPLQVLRFEASRLIFEHFAASFSLGLNQCIVRHNAPPFCGPVRRGSRKVNYRVRTFAGSSSTSGALEDQLSNTALATLDL